MPKEKTAPPLRRYDTVVTAHSNADFDAAAAIIAAGKLFPDAALIFPGSQEKNLRNFYIQSAMYLFNFVDPKDIDQEAVKRLIVVDTRQRSRLNHVHRILENPGVQIIAYDHHPDTDEDVPCAECYVEPLGATTTLLLREIRKRGITLNPDEATILALGVYEDTGAFTFNSTTEEDFLAAAWLKNQGMDVNVVSDLLHRDMTSEQIAILNALIESARTHEINGQAVVVAEASLDRYVGDFALLAHKLMDMENIRALFALGRMEDRVQVVARSRTPDVDVGLICSSLGGGGHSYAASASIKDRTLPQVKDELFALLFSHINPKLVVRTLMSAPAVTVSADAPIDKAVEVMLRYGLKTLPVVDPGDGRLAGVIDHAPADKAQAHGLGAVPVGEYMIRDCAVVTPESDLFPVMEAVIGKRQRLVPVVEDGLVVGVLTRNDLVHILAEEPARIPESLIPEKKRERNIRTLMDEHLPKWVRGLLQKAGRLGQDLGNPVYVVGGFVRDILLKRENTDVDLVVEGDAVYFAKALAQELGGRVRAHPKFQTAKLIYHEQTVNREIRLDCATARLEYYEYPAALPIVELSSIKMDLFRRDFTVNTLAVQLNPGAYGRLVDFFGAQKDVKDGVIRVLHALSFVEDPTRILRAVRFETRFGFSLDKQSERLVKNAVGLNLLKKLSGARVWNEFRLIFRDVKPLTSLRRLRDLKILDAVHPNLTLTHPRERLVEELEKVLDWWRLLYLDGEPRTQWMYLLALISGMIDDEVRAILDRLAFPQRAQNDFLALRAEVRSAEHKLAHRLKQPESGVWELFQILEHTPIEGVLYLMARAKDERTRKDISHFLTKLRGLCIDVSGEDLKELGLNPGPSYGRILRRLLKAKVEGAVGGRDEQRVMALDFAFDETGPKRPEDR